MPVSSSVVTTVQALLDAAGLVVSEQEFQSFIETYPLMREGADRLYLEELRYEEPVGVFAPFMGSSSDETGTTR